jgi:hypothetical protein
MQENHETYTYTARSANDPSKVVTFTIYDQWMQVDLTGILDKIRHLASAEEKPEAARQIISTQFKPMMTKMLENISAPVHISDVNAYLEAGKLKITLWQRIKGLRLAPILFNMQRIDNQDAAEAFVNELNLRKSRTSHAGRFAGPLDYWLGWIGLIILLVLLLRWQGGSDKGDYQE